MVLPSNPSSSPLQPSLSTLTTSNPSRRFIYQGESCPLSFVLHKILDILQKEKKQITFSQLEAILRNLGFSGIDIYSDTILLDALINHDRINIDVTKKIIHYNNPYQTIDTLAHLKNVISKNGFLYGLRVSDDLLNSHQDIIRWINELLSVHQIRCVRPTTSHLRGKLKCRFAGTDRQCDLYASQKCRECFHNVKDLILYPLAEEEFESARNKMDKEIREIWDQIQLPPLEQILKKFNIDLPHLSWNTEHSNRNLRKKQASARLNKARSKMRRIQNTHLFTAEELRRDLA